MKTKMISSGQWAGILLVSRLAASVTFAPLFGNSTDLWSALLYGLTLLIVLLPSIWLNRRTGGSNILRQARAWNPWLGKGVAAALALYCLYVLTVGVMQFMAFVRESLSPDMSAAALCVALMAAAFWAAWYGIEAIARAVLPIAVLLVGSVLAVVILLVPEMKSGYLTDAFLASATASGWLSETVRTTEVAVAGLLLSHTAAPRTFRSAVWPSLGVAGLIFLIRLSVTATFGRFAEGQLYPYHTAVTVIDVGSFRRADLLVVAIWIAAIFVRMTVFAWAFSHCVHTCVRRPIRRWIVPLGVVAATVIGIFGRISPTEGVNWWLIGISLGGILLFAVIGPLVFLMCKKGESIS